MPSANQSVLLNDAYLRLAAERNDQCSIIQLASRAVAPLFAGAMAAALVLAEVQCPSRAECVHPVLDLSPKNLRHRGDAERLKFSGLVPPFGDARQ